VQREHFPAAQNDAARARQLGNLASAYKAQGMPLKSLKAGLKLARVRPLAGIWAVLRSLTPMPVLRATRRLKGQAQ
jgi:hypothetical protein